ncbi:MAG TPA: hypothetical protein VKO18_13195 [Terriglobia bacterium]|nr:hypothetical protein [Terriglobia bacterium]
MEIMEDPYPETPGERERRLSEVREFITLSAKIPADLKPELITKASAFVETKIEGGGSKRFYGGQLGWTHWVIRNEHLKLVEVLASVAIAITTYAAVATAVPAVTAVTLLFAAVALADRLKHKSASLDDKSYAVVMTLKEIGPTTPAQLSQALNGVRIFGRDLWTDSGALDALKKLQAIRLGDGSVEALVSQAADGLWSTNGI